MDRPPGSKDPNPTNVESNLLRNQERFTILEPPTDARETNTQQICRKIRNFKILGFLLISVIVLSIFGLGYLVWKNQEQKETIVHLESEMQELLDRLDDPTYFVNQTKKEEQMLKVDETEYLDELFARKREYEEKMRLMSEAESKKNGTKSSHKEEEANIPEYEEGFETDDGIEDGEYAEYENEKIVEAIGNATVIYDDDDEKAVELPTDDYTEETAPTPPLD
ncbi:Protein CBG26447 [Caenorhabditis briggsae]|uniref:Uncharacterized protein n=2 Tax=Caenorhabditis briggsae TaxID=6238 RepID=A0AAE9AF01_CAEBR|nr:Protein CBG26447 [Caenorhabditis briggsae]ULT96595.1 hypothetical protein L3Y34_004873 [Caenorhabditis briggsae]CAR98464.1 Protein CBG26447 [Caenorhabditis briggsae]